MATAVMGASLNESHRCPNSGERLRLFNALV